jgi:hypothetical protein
MSFRTGPIMFSTPVCIEYLPAFHLLLLNFCEDWDIESSFKDSTADLWYTGYVIGAKSP